MGRDPDARSAARPPRIVLPAFVTAVVLVPAFVLLKGWGFEPEPVAGVVVMFAVPLLLARRYRTSIADVTKELRLLPVDLAIAIAPLLLVAAVIVLYASRALKWGPRLAVGTVVGAVMVAIVTHELGAVKELVEWLASRSRFGQRTAVIRLLGQWGVAAALSIVIILPLPTDLGRYGGFAGVAEAVAIAIAAAAIVARLASTTRRLISRRLLVLVVTLVLLRFALSWTGLPGGRATDAVDRWSRLDDTRWSIILAVSILVASVWEVPARLRPPKAPPESISTKVAAWGFIAACVSAIVFAVAFIVAAYGARLDVRDYGGSGPITIGGKAIAAAPDDAIAAAFAPAFQFAKGEQWFPSDAAEYLGQSRLLDLSENQVAPEPNERLTVEHLADYACRDPTLNVCHMISCDLDACTAASADGDKPIVYALVVRRKPGVRKPQPDDRFFVGRAPFAEPVTTIVEYWLFYRYDRWEAITPIGYLVQQHAADWEAVVVGLSDTRPLFVAYSSHCGGHWFDWRYVERDELHPVVAVALGSHANYDQSWYGRPPDWGSCKKVPEDATWALTYASNVRDRTGDGREFTAADDELKMVTDDDPLLTAGIRWSTRDETAIGRARHHVIGRPQRGPTSPGMKRLWNRPLQAIFGDPSWHRGKHDAVRSDRGRRAVAFSRDLW